MAEGAPLDEAEPFLRLWGAARAAPADAAATKRLADAAGTLWRAACAPTWVGGPGAKSADAALPPSLQQSTGNSATAALTKPIPVEIGRTALTESEKWKLQAAMRREETKAAGKEYNKKLLRPTKTTKGPTPGEGFAAGRGRPIK